MRVKRKREKLMEYVVKEMRDEGIQSTSIHLIVENKRNVPSFEA